MEKFYYSYNHFKEDAKNLKEQLDTEFDTIVPIARGGLTLAHMLAQALDIRNVQSISTQLYDGMEKRNSITIKGECDFSDSKNILIVDDIADSGETLKALYNHFTLANEALHFKTATLFYKKSSVFKPDYWVREAKGWIDFFWEVDLIS